MPVGGSIENPPTSEYLGLSISMLSSILANLVESYSLAVGDKVFIIGPTTGVVETTIISLHVNDFGSKPFAQKGDLCAFHVGTQIRKTDKLYKIVQTQEVVQ